MYSEFINDLETGDILLFNPINRRGVMGRLFHKFWFKRRKTPHMAMVLKNPTDNKYIDMTGIYVLESGIDSADDTDAYDNIKLKVHWTLI